MMLYFRVRLVKLVVCFFVEPLGESVAQECWLCLKRDVVREGIEVVKRPV
jgi:hypothetical protein